MHNFIKISLWILFTAGTIVLAGFTTYKYNETECKKPNVIVHKIGEFNFIQDDYILKTLHNKGYVFSDQNISEINISEVEKHINSLPEVESSEVYKTLDGTIEISIIERHPILRITNATGQQFYIDNKGHVMPLSENFVANTHIATGHINYAFIGDKKSILNHNTLKSLYNITQHIVKDTFLNSQIVQIDVAPKQDIILIPRVGEQKILFGKGTDIEDKFNRLKTFYKKGIKPSELNKYKTLNLKYKQQIICSKR